MCPMRNSKFPLMISLSLIAEPPVVRNHGGHLTSQPARRVMVKTNTSLTIIGFFFSSLFSILLVLGTVQRAEAQVSTADTVRFLEQSTFGPTSALIASVQQGCPNGSAPSVC